MLYTIRRDMNLVLRFSLHNLNAIRDTRYDFICVCFYIGNMLKLFCNKSIK